MISIRRGSFFLSASYIQAVAMFVLLIVCSGQKSFAQACIEWAEAYPPSGPQSRSSSAMAYDSDREVVVLFGGSDAGLLDDTWEWDGSNWSQRNTPTTPSPTFCHTMVYDSARHVVVMAGGDHSFETWEYDGSDWSLRTTVGPPWTEYAAMAYDPIRQQTIQFGGNMSDNKTWAWDGTSWKQLNPFPAPSPRVGHGMVWDPVREVIVLFGGGSYSGGIWYCNNDVWQWDGSTWTQVNSQGPFRAHFGMTYDTNSNRVLVFGGVDDTMAMRQETWSWDGSTWRNHGASGPQKRRNPAVAWDAARGVSVLFGGYNYIGGTLDDTWTLASTLTTFLQQPADVTAPPTAQAVFEVTLSESLNPDFQWRKDGLPLTSGGRIQCADCPQLTINDLQSDDSGVYDVVVTDECGPVISDSAVLTVADLEAPVVTLLDPICLPQCQVIEEPLFLVNGRSDDFVGVVEVRWQNLATGESQQVFSEQPPGNQEVYWPAEINLAPGKNTVVFEALDAAGNVGSETAIIDYVGTIRVHPYHDANGNGEYDDGDYHLSNDASVRLASSTIQLQTEPNTPAWNELVGVPLEEYHTIEVSHTYHRNSYTPGIRPTAAQPIIDVEIPMTPLNGNQFRVIELDPNPNPTDPLNPLQVMLGGTARFYFQVVDEFDQPRNGIPVRTMPDQGQILSTSNEFGVGIVVVDIPVDYLANVEEVRVTEVQYSSIPWEEQKAAYFEALPKSHRKSWELASSLELGLSNAVGEAEGAMVIEVSENQEGVYGPEEIIIGRKAILGQGGRVSYKVGIDCEVANLGPVGEFGTSAKMIIGGTVGDHFGYEYNDPDDIDNQRKLYLLTYPLGLLHPTLQSVQRAMDPSLMLNETREGFHAGCYVKGKGSVSAELGIATPDVSVVPLAFKAAADMGAGSKIGTRYIGNDADGAASIAMDLTREVTGTGEVTASIFESDVFDSLPLFRAGGAFTTGLQFRHDFDDLGIIKSSSITIKNGQDLQGEVYTEGETIETRFVITGSEPTLEQLGNFDAVSGIFSLLRHSYGASTAAIIPVGKGTLSREVNNLLSQLQTLRDATITYEKTRTYSNKAEVSPFSIDVGFGIGIDVSLTADTGVSLDESQSYVIEKGRLIGARSYPQIIYTEDDYPTIDTTLIEIYEKALTDFSNLNQLLNAQQRTAQAGQAIDINVNQASLHIEPDVLPENQVVVASQPDAVTTMQTMSSSSDPIVPPFSISGVLQLEPSDIVLSQPASLQIHWGDDGGYDPQHFQIYRWDEQTEHWELIGIDVPGAAPAEVEIDRFGVYTLAARVPYGTFTLTPAQASIPADETSAVSFTSETVLNNDGTPVEDGVLFTLATTGGEVTTPDADPTTEGTQIAISGGAISFTLQSDLVGRTVVVNAVNREQTCTLTGEVIFTDTTAPNPPTAPAISLIDGRVWLSWTASTSPDVAGYRVYFDTDSPLPPYDGISYGPGADSPFDVGNLTSIHLRGLQTGQWYYYWVTALDFAGNESATGAILSYEHTLPPDWDSDGLPDDYEFAHAHAIYGLDPTLEDADDDNDGDGLANNVERDQGTDPTDPDSDDDGVIDGDDDCVDTPAERAVSANGCLFPRGDADLDGDVDEADLAAIEQCATGPAVPYPLPDITGPGCPTAIDGMRWAVDADRDQDVDQADFGLWQRCLSGSEIPADVDCM